MAFRTRDTDQPPPRDPEDMTLEMLARRVRLLVEYSLIDYQDQLAESDARLDVEQIVEEVVDAVRQREKKSRSYSFGRSNKANLDQPSRAFLTNVITSKKLEPYKNVLIGRHRTKLDVETLTIWFIQRLLGRAIDHHWHYVAMVMLKILFLYDHDRFIAVTSLLELFKSRHQPPADHQLRRWKKKTIDDLETWFGNLVETTKETVGPHPKKHFKRPAAPEESLDLTIECLRIEALPRETCVLLQQNALESRADIRRLLEELTASKSADAVERILMHLLTCPDALFPSLRALGINSFGERLGIPLFRVSGETTVPLRRRDIVKGQQPPHKTDIVKRLQDRDDRRGKLTLDRMQIAVDDVVRQSLSSDEPKTFTLSLEHGERIIEVRAEDEKGSLPLDLHYVSWSPDLENRPYVFVTNLKGGRQLEFLVTYSRDEFGDLSKASVEVTYTPDTRKSWVMYAACGAGLLALVTAIKFFNPSEVPVSVIRIVIALLASALPAGLFMTRKHGTRLGVLALALSVLAILFALPIRWSSHQAPSTDKAEILDDASTSALGKRSNYGQLPPPKPGPVANTEAPNGAVAQESKTVKSMENTQPLLGLNGISWHPKERHPLTGQATTYSQPAVREPTAVASGREQVAINGGAMNPQPVAAQKVDEPTAFVVSTQLNGVESSRTADIQTAGMNNYANRRARKHNVMLKKDQIIQVEVIDPISSESSQDGTFFRTTVVRAIYVDGEVVVPKETVAMGRVSKVSTTGQGAVRASLEVQLVILELPNQTARIDGELLAGCPDQSNADKTDVVFAPQPRPKVAFVGDHKKGAVIAPVPDRRIMGHSSRVVGSSYLGGASYSSGGINAVVEPGKEPAIRVCFALKKSVSISPPRLK